MSTVLVTGGTGHLGRDIVRLLIQRGDRVRVLARRPGQNPEIEWIKGDVGTGAGFREAVDGVDAIVHAATNSPAARRGRPGLRDMLASPSDVDVVGTRKLLAEARRCGVDHFVHISIVGVQQARVPYSRVKAEAENVVKAGGVPWSIVPGTPFYWLLARILDQLSGRRIWPLPSNVDIQPADSADFAQYVTECLADGPGGVRADFGGPEILSLIEAARQFQRARGLNGRIIRMRMPKFMLRSLGPQTCPDGRQGKTTWSEWLNQ